MRRYGRQQAAERLVWGAAYEDSGLVFTDERGAGYHPKRLTKMFTNHVAVAKLPPARLHGRRLDGGVPLKVMSERLDHSSIAITADIYMAVSEHADRDAAETIAAVILGQA